MTPTKLFHYSINEILSLEYDFYDPEYKTWLGTKGHKPCGFWVSVEDFQDDHSWFDWCKSEQFSLEGLRHKYSVTLSSDANILHLKSVEEILAFSMEYAVNDPLDFSRKYPFTNRQYFYIIAWDRVQAKYDGIIISPYQWKLRLAPETSWYYGWDCSSGCIWNLDKISIKLDSLIDVESITDKAVSEESELVENVMDSLLASLAQSV